MKYRYSTVSGQLNTDGRYTKRPVVEVTAARPNHKRTFLALVDSGADQIIMPAAIADVFGIDRAQCTPRTVLGVSMEGMAGFVHLLTLHIRDLPGPFEAPVVFIDADVPVLLGREGFFDRHRIKFEQDHDTFEIVPMGHASTG